MQTRLGEFGLEVSLEKTNIISFSKYNHKNGNTFEFLGFEFRWGYSRRRKLIILKRTTRTKLRKSIKNFTDWIKSYRNKRLWKIFKKLNSKLIGYYNYYGMINNYKSLHQFYYAVTLILFKWLNRRSQRRSFTWDEFNIVLKKYKIETPRIT